MFDAAVAAADPMVRIKGNLPPRPKGRLVVIGAGKASARMAEAVESQLGPCEGLVITRYGYDRPCKGIEILQAAHPVPDAAGVEGTGRMLDLLSGLGPDDLVLALISGGGSALLCAPAGQITLAEKQAVNAALLASGAPIDQMNTVRKHLSRVKGGQLAAAASPAPMLALVISDVPGDDMAFIASGPTVGDDSTAADALAILENYNIDIPDSVSAVLGGASGVLPANHPVFQKVENRIIAAPSQSMEAATEMAKGRGYEVRLLGDALEGEARDLAAEQAVQARDIARSLKPGDAPVLLLSGGECTVTRRGNGVGGPNAEFMLAAAIALAGDPAIHAIACDTDGVDGAAEVAGAIIDPTTLARAAERGLDPAASLANNDAHTFFADMGDQVVTGPTLTNVNDFRAFLIHPPAG
jgi:hydroxypyruvate reductase